MCKSDGRDIDIVAFVVNDSYYNPNIHKSMLGIPVVPYRDVDLNDPNIVLMIGYMHYDFYDSEIPIPSCKGRFVAGDVCCIFDKSGNDKFLDYEYFKNNEAAFENVSHMLADDKSRQVLEAYINQRISANFAYLDKVWEKDQYFPGDIVNLNKVQCFVDCGAYNGDSFLQFQKAFLRDKHTEYMGAAFLLETEENNVSSLLENTQGLSNIHVLKKGAWCKRDVLFFSGFGAGGSVGSSGDTKIEVDSIDNVVAQRVDFIKMDIEGAEYEALQGARDHIVNDCPILAICVYHKRDDLLKIPTLIQSMRSDYKFYLRAHSRHATEIVLYAVPA